MPARHRGACIDTLGVRVVRSGSQTEKSHATRHHFLVFPTRPSLPNAFATLFVAAAPLSYMSWALPAVPVIILVGEVFGESISVRYDARVAAVSIEVRSQL